MSTDFNWDQFKSVEGEEGFDWGKYEPAKEEPSRFRSLVSAPFKGIIKGSSDLNPIHPSGPIPKNSEEKILERVLPTQQKTPEKLLERAGKLLPIVALGPESIPAKILQLLAGSAGGQIAESEGLGEFGQGISEAASMSLPSLLNSGGRKLASLLGGETEKLASGITKPRALDSKFTKNAAISPKRQDKVIQQLNEEAAKIAKSSVENRLPISKKIKEGVDFEKNFEEGFKNLQKTAEKANPEIDITNVSKYLSKNAGKYRGIPQVHPEGKKVLQEVRALSNRPQTSLKNLLKIYRSNNQKIKGIYETSRISGRQKEYVDFLTGLNRNIAKSFEETLPKNSSWVKEFKELNSGYAEYKNASQVMNQIQGVLEAKPTPSTIQRLAEDTKSQGKLRVAMGKEGADEIIQIAKDLKAATASIKKIPAKEWKAWEYIFPLGVFIPGLHIPGWVGTAKKGFDLGKRGYGFLLSTPAKRKAYNKALRSITERNKYAYIKAVQELVKEIDKSEEKTDLSIKENNS